MNAILVWIITAAAQTLAAAPPPPATCPQQPAVVPAYACHRWTMQSDQSIVCDANGHHALYGDYRFERSINGLVAIIER